MTGQMERTTEFCVRATKEVFDKNQNGMRIHFWLLEASLVAELFRQNR